MTPLAWHSEYQSDAFTMYLGTVGILLLKI